MGAKVSTPWFTIRFRAANPSDAEKIGEFVEQNDPETLYDFVQSNQELLQIAGGIPFSTCNAEVPEFTEALSPEQGAKIAEFIVKNSQ